MTLRERLRCKETQFHVELVYGLLFVAGFGYLAVRVDPRVAAFEGGLVVGYLLRVWEKMAIYERVLEEAVADEAEQRVADEAEQQVAAELDEQVGDAVDTEVTARVGDLDERIGEEVEAEVAAELEDAVSEEVEAELEDAVSAEVENEFDRRVEDVTANGEGSEET